MRHFARVFAALAALLFFTAAAQAVPTCTRFWVGGGSSTAWTATGNTNWSTTSNGANNASVPTTTDVVCFDSHSGSATSNISASITVLDVDFTGNATGASGSYAGTLTQASSTTLTLGGNFFELTPAMTYAAGANTQALSFTDATASDTIVFKSAGHTLGNITVNPVNTTTFQLQASDPLTLRTDSNFTLTQGIFDNSTNNDNVAAKSFIANTTADTRTVNLGTGTYTLVNDFDLSSSASNLTCSAASATINITGPLAAIAAFNGGGGCSFGAVSFACTGCTTWPVIFANGNAVIGTLSFTAGEMYFAMSSSTITVTNAVNWAGTPGSSGLLIIGYTGSDTLSLTGGGTISWAQLRGLGFTGTAPIITNSFDFGGNSGVTITGPGSGGGGGIIGG